MANEYAVNQSDLVLVANAIRAKGETLEDIMFPDGFVTAIKNISGGLNFSIIGGTAEPANPTENTIWINTETEITSWVFSLNEPANAGDGMVWILTSVSSSVEFNALKKNGITVYPISVNQYIGGTWVDKTAKSYQRGKWVEWIKYLYDKGDECTDITGGWTNINGMEYNGYINKGDYTNDGDAYKLSVSAASSHIARITNKRIDLIDVKKISVYALESNGGNLVISNNNTKLSSDADPIIAEKEIGPGISSIDVSEISGSYYIATRIMNTAQQTGSKIMTISQIWME